MYGDYWDILYIVIYDIWPKGNSTSIAFYVYGYNKMLQY